MVSSLLFAAEKSFGLGEGLAVAAILIGTAIAWRIIVTTTVTVTETEYHDPCDELEEEMEAEDKASKERGG